MADYPERFCVVCARPVLNLSEYENPYKARKCVSCKEAEITTAMVFSAPHCVHCRTSLAERGNVAWACFPICAKGKEARNNPLMKNQSEEAKQRRKYIAMTAPRPAAERRRSARSRAVRLGRKGWRHQRLDCRCAACVKAAEEKKEKAPKGNILSRVEKLRN